MNLIDFGNHVSPNDILILLYVCNNYCFLLGLGDKSILSINNIFCFGKSRFLFHQRALWASVAQSVKGSHLYFYKHVLQFVFSWILYYESKFWEIFSVISHFEIKKMNRLKLEIKFGMKKKKLFYF